MDFDIASPTFITLKGHGEHPMEASSLLRPFMTGSEAPRSGGGPGKRRSSHYVAGSHSI